MSTQTKAVIGTDLTALIAIGIYIVTEKVTEYRNGELKRTITIDDKDLLKSYQSKNGRIIARGMNGEDIASSNLKKSESDTAFNVTQKYGERCFKNHYQKQ